MVARGRQLGAVEDEPHTLLWYGLRRGGQEFEIFETFPNELVRVRRLTGSGAQAAGPQRRPVGPPTPRPARGRADK